jgi:hypothetical protein
VDHLFEVSYKNRALQISKAFVLKKGTTNTQEKNVEQEMFDQCCITRYQKNFTLAPLVIQVRTFLIFL